ncbi:MAG: type I-F CRISPR-associated endoribonuclease Cas6/Csy4 [Alcanivoracaceae bacterium]
MDHYIDIRLRPDPEFPAAMLMGALYGKLHRALVDLQADDIGVSFPGHKLRPRMLGDQLRLHGSAGALASLMAQPWLVGMHDHIVVSSASRAPTEAKHCLVRRRQFKTNVERLRRRRMRRHGETPELVRQRIPDSVEKKVDLPFVTLRSRSTGQSFSLFIEHGEPQRGPVDGPFNQYGLSSQATVPWF